MQEAKNTARAIVRIGYDGRVHKTFLATDAKTRFENEVRVLKYLERRGCNFVPRVLETHPDELRIVTTSCGARVEQISEGRMKELFAELEGYGVRHDDPYLRNITYRASDGRFCIIDFEFATILAPDEVCDAAPSAVVATPALVEPRSLSIRWSAMTDRGKVRPNNEDAFLGIAFDTHEFFYLGKTGDVQSKDRDFVFAVSDGMGGENSGEFASKFAVDNITRMLPRRFRMSQAHQASGIGHCLYDLFHAIHRQLTTLGQSYAQGHNMGATLSLVWYIGGQFFFGHIGDSRIYHLPAGGGMRQISEDHTYVGWLRRGGKLNEREARSHPRKNVLAQSLGSGNRYIEPQLGEIHCEPGDRFVLCTDGVVEGLWDHAIEDLVRSPPAAMQEWTPAQRLVQSAIAESGRDNTTALVLEIV